MLREGRENSNESCMFMPQEVQRGKPATVRVNVRNSSSEEIAPYQIVLSVHGKVVEEKEINVPVAPFLHVAHVAQVKKEPVHSLKFPFRAQTLALLAIFHVLCLYKNDGHWQ